jgi:hypothetical protein
MKSMRMKATDLDSWETMQKVDHLALRPNKPAAIDIVNS